MFFRNLLCATVTSRTASICMFGTQYKNSHMLLQVQNGIRIIHNGSTSRYFHLKLNRNDYNYSCFRKFKVTSQKNANPVVWIIIRPVINILAALTGRRFRKWWKSLPPNRKLYFLQALKHNRRKIYVGISMFALLSCGYYYSHIEETPITKRKRFMAYEPRQFKLISQAELQNITAKYHGRFLPPYHPYTRRVAMVVDQILHSNKDIKELAEKKFRISVIHDEKENAFVLPNGEIFVLTGMLNLCSNNDQLGAVIAHEMSHCILAHSAEIQSLLHFVDFFMFIVVLLIWALLPNDFMSVFCHWFATKTAEVVFHLPYSRNRETEADEVGLLLAAKSCFDIRECSAFWAKMDIMKCIFPEHMHQEVEFLSTHPSHRKRASHLDGLMEQALKLRSDCGCPRLKLRDPRLEVEKVARQLQQERQKYSHQPIVVTLVPPMR